jgi:hypothetical protein
MIPRFEHIWHKGFGYAVDGNEITVHLDREMTLVMEKIVEAMLPQGFGRGFGSLDAAVFRIEPPTHCQP